MKKLIFGGMALIGFATTSYAQNVSTVNQNGTSQTAVAAQTGNGQVSTISQVGSASATNFGNYGATSQTGATSNTATVNQNNGSNGNRAYATQLGGNGNKATISQSDNSGGGATAASVGAAGGDGNFAGTYQKGDGNTAGVNQNNDSQRNLGEVRQNGMTNTGTVNQSNTSRDNTGKIYQGFADDNVLQPLTGVNSSTATINQGKTNPGDMNFTPGVAAESVSNTATVTQTADNNRALIGQGTTISDINGTSTGRSAGSIATIVQSAAGNTAEIEQGAQSGESRASKGTITQTGTGNFGTILQGVLNFGLDNGGEATITQAGTNGSVAYIQVGILGVATSSTATINQTSASNNTDAYIYQAFGGNSTSTNDKAGITQGGTGDNFAQIVQGSAPSVGTASSSGNSATITQGDGTSNSEALINQGRDDLGSAINNVAVINQVSGNLNNALISQGRAVAIINGAGSEINTGVVSTGSSATVTQDGNNNTGNIYQADGAGTGGNMATLMQTGNMNTAKLYQEGTALKATITQMGDMNVLDGGVAGSVATQMGTNNTATVMQTSAAGGPGNVAHLMQSGSGNNASIIQSTIMP